MNFFSLTLILTALALSTAPLNAASRSRFARLLDPYPSLSQWQTSHGITDLTADPDENGFNFLAEYAFVRERLPGSTSGVGQMEQLGAETYLTIAYDRPTGGAPGTGNSEYSYGGVSYRTQWSNDLAHWSSGSSFVLPVSITQNSNTLTERVVLRAAQPAGVDAQFMRVRVSHPDSPPAQDPIGYLAVGWLNSSAIDPAHADGLRVATSTDGVYWEHISPNPVYWSVTGEVRDPSIIKLDDTYYVSFTERANGTTGRFSVIKSTDLINWELVARPDLRDVTPAITWVYGPWFLVDPEMTDFTDVHLVVGTDINTCYEMHPLNSELTVWSTPALFNGTSGTRWYKTGGTYYMFEDSGYVGDHGIRRKSSSSLLGPYTTTQTNMGNFAPYQEQQPQVNVSGTHWRIWIDHTIGYDPGGLPGVQPGFTVNNDGSYYADSYDNGATWTALQKCGSDGVEWAIGCVLPIRDAQTWANILSTVP